MASGKVVTRRTSPLSKSQQKHWEQVLFTYCEFGLGQEYQELAEESKRLMMSALEISVKNAAARLAQQMGTMGRAWTRRKNAKDSVGDPLKTALKETGATGRLDEEMLDHIRERFLPSWGAPALFQNLILEHDGVSDQLRSDQKEFNICSTVASVQKPSRSSSWDHLRAISIGDLRLFQTMSGMRLECAVVGHPIQMVGITTLIQDAAGQAVLCGIYNLPGVTNQATANKALPKGSTVIIAEPFLKIMADGRRGVRVDNPDEIDIFLPGVRPLIRKAGSISARASDGNEASKMSQDQKGENQTPIAELAEDFRPGQRVKLFGLTSKKGATLNGKFGVVAAEQDEHDLERVTVELDSDAGKPELVKIKPSNMEIAQETDLENILQAKKDANEAFARGELHQAIEAYNGVAKELCSHKTPKAMTELTKCICDRALCFLKLRQWEAARVDSQSVLEREPTNAKAHFRLASASFQEGNAESQEKIHEAATHICVAIALAPTGEAAMTDLLDAIASKSARPLPQAKEVVAVGDASELWAALQRDRKKFIAIKPGDYGPTHKPFWAEHDATLVGLGSNKVRFLKRSSHVFSVVMNARVQMFNLTITDSPQASHGYGCCSVDSGAWLKLSGCIVENCCEVGVIVARGGRCIIEDCQFRRLGSQAVEVREMGQVEIRRSQFLRVWQGVVAYAGARSLVMEDVLIEGSFHEGVCACGDLKTDETRKLEKLPDPDAERIATPGWRKRDQAYKMGRQISMFASEWAEDMGWNGRLALSMSTCTITNAQGLACSFDTGCAAHLSACTFQKSVSSKTTRWYGTGLMIKGGSDVTVNRCRFLKNEVGVDVGFNYGGDVLIENSIFAGNLFKDVIELGQERKTQEMFEGSFWNRHKQAGAWSAPIRTARNQFLSKSARVPEIHELESSSSSRSQGQPLPQKLAWEAAARQSYVLATPCLCGFLCTELGNSPECSQLGLGNHIDFPPFMCLPCSDALRMKQDDVNAQFYFRDEERRTRSRHWCLLGTITSVGVARTADAHSFMAFRGAEAAKSVKLKTKFADSEPEVEVLMMLDEPLSHQSSALQSGCTLAILYAEASDIDIRQGTGQVIVTDNSLVYAFAAPLDQIMAQSFAADESICGSCGKDTSESSTQSCSACGVVSYCSSKCRSDHNQRHKELCPQMAMLRQLAVTDFRSDPDVQLSFPLWAEGLPTIPAVPPHAPHDASLSEPEAQDEAKEPSAETSRAPSAPKVEDLCSFLDSASDADMAKAVASVEEALQAKDTAGAFVIQKQNGRPRLQNKLKRTKARLADLLAKSAEPSTQPQQRQAHPPEISQEEREDYAEDQGAEGSLCGLGPTDQDGYHGVPELPRWKAGLPYRRCARRSFFHAFESYPRSLPCPSEPWCTNINPAAFCFDFKELARSGRVRTLSCWGHSASRPGHKIPSVAGSHQRLWKLRPSEITFSQNSIGRNFSDGNSLDQTYDDLRAGRCKVEDIEKIKITWHSHVRSPGEPRWWTYTGNRRLSLFQKLEEEGRLKFLVAEWVNEPVPEWRMTTENGGGRPSVRGGRKR